MTRGKGDGKIVGEDVGGQNKMVKKNSLLKRNKPKRGKERN